MKKPVAAQGGLVAPSLGLGCLYQYVDAGTSAPSHARAAGAAGKEPVAKGSQWDQ